MENYSVFIILGCYVALFAVAVAGFYVWKIKRRRERPPLEFKLLRAPGESLRRRMAKFDEEAFFRVSGAALFPLLVASVPLWAFTKFKPTTWPQFYAWLVVISAVVFAALVVAFRWAVKDLNRYRDDRLGYLGERAVGEALLGLQEPGFIVFHDVPAEVKGQKFNVDHVVVGPTGLFAIETKTRRKGRARQGFEDHKVTYDGKRLIWPWGEDDFGLRNAADRARYLTEWLTKMTGLGLTAKPVLVLPGWYVIPGGLGPVTVVNHKQLTHALLRGSRTSLTADQIDLVARQLDQLCRDVED